MDGTKFVKARCNVTGKYYGLEVLPIGRRFEVVDMVDLDDEKAKVLTSEIHQDDFETHNNLQPCRWCKSRKVGKCSCTQKHHVCKKDSPYEFMCIYCREFKIDYSTVSKDKLGQFKDGDWVVTPQGKRVKIITFSNVEWKKFDNIQKHEDGRKNGFLNEPTVHVIANEKNIEFHGYNISAMDEGVYYEIEKGQGFSISCKVDTSLIAPHPGGNFYINFGAIAASIDQSGGSFFLGGNEVAAVGCKFQMRLVLTENGVYEIWINGIKKGELFQRQKIFSKNEIRFGFKHDAHFCNLLSHAYLKDIDMTMGQQ